MSLHASRCRRDQSGWESAVVACWDIMGPCLGTDDVHTPCSWLLMLSVLGETRTSGALPGFGISPRYWKKSVTRSCYRCFPNPSLGLCGTFLPTALLGDEAKPLEAGRANWAFASHFKLETFILGDSPGGKGIVWILLSVREAFFCFQLSFCNIHFFLPVYLPFVFASALITFDFPHFCLSFS